MVVPSFGCVAYFIWHLLNQGSATLCLSSHWSRRTKKQSQPGNPKTIHKANLPSTSAELVRARNPPAPYRDPQTGGTPASRNPYRDPHAPVEPPVSHPVSRLHGATSPVAPRIATPAVEQHRDLTSGTSRATPRIATSLLESPAPHPVSLSRPPSDAEDSKQFRYRAAPRIVAHAVGKPKGEPNPRIPRGVFGKSSWGRAEHPLGPDPKPKIMTCGAREFKRNIQKKRHLAESSDIVRLNPRQQYPKNIQESPDSQ